MPKIIRHFLSDQKTFALLFLLLAGPTTSLQAMDANMLRLDQLLIHTAETNDLVNVRQLLARGVPVDSRGVNDFTGLHLASGKGFVEMVKCLLSSEADVNARNKSGWTPLHMAATTGQTEVVRILLDAGAEIDAVNINGTTALHSAAMGCHTSTVRLLLERKARLNKPNANGYTELLMAAKQHKLPGCLETARALLEQGADLTASVEGLTALDHARSGKNYDLIALLLLKQGVTPTPALLKSLPSVHLAAAGGNCDVVRYLLSTKSCLPDELDKHGCASLHYAAGRGAPHIISCLVEAGASINLMSTDENKEESVVALLDKGADIEATTLKEKHTALHIAVGLKNHAIAKLLLARGASVEARDNDGNTPIHFAVSVGDRRMIEILRAAGADINARRVLAASAPPVLNLNDPRAQEQDLVETMQNWLGAYDDSTSENHTALHMAVYEGKTALVEHLIELGADVLAADEGGNIPLHTAAFLGHLDLVKLFLSKRVLIEAKNKKGCTPLISAIDGGKEAVVACLLKHKADPSATSGEGWSALHCAVQKKALFIVELLLDAGAPWDQTYKGNTALHVAARMGSPEICALIQKSMVRSKLLSKSPEASSSILCGLWCLRRSSLPKELIERTFSSVPQLGDDLLAAAAHSITGKKFFQILMKRVSTICGPVQAAELLRRYAQECFDEAYARTNEAGNTAAACARMGAFEDLAQRLTPGYTLDKTFVKHWLEQEQDRHGVIEYALAKESEQPAKISQGSLKLKCLACEKTGKLMRCGKCKKVYFCNSTCQKKVWAQHKSDCKE